MKSSSQKKLSVVVVESDPVRYLGLSAIFSSEPDMQVRSATVPSLLRGMKDDIVLMTICRGSTFYAGMAALKGMHPTIRIIVTGPGNQDEDALRAVSAGAKGYVSEDAAPDQFKKALREVHAGSVWLPRRVLATFIERATVSPRRMQPRPEARISGREREVLQLLVSGCSNREIASELGIIERTVKAHVGQLLRKVGVPNRIALSVHAVTHSLLQAPQ
jgi:DNA-binding NarL/FixJ family response regulator